MTTPDRTPLQRVLVVPSHHVTYKEIRTIGRVAVANDLVNGYHALTAASATKTVAPIDRIPQSIQVVPRAVIGDTILPVGDMLQRVPQHAGRLAAHYRFAGSLDGCFAGAGFTATSRRAVDLPNTASTENLADRRAYDPFNYLGR